MDTDLNLLANRIKEIRNKLDLNQKEFAEKIKISKGYLSEIENGKYSPGFAFFYNLATEFNVNLYYLFFGEGDMFKTVVTLGSETPTEPDKSIQIDTDEEFHQLIDLMKKSSLVKHSILAFFMELIHSKQDIIAKDLERYNSLKEDNTEKL